MDGLVRGIGSIVAGMPRRFDQDEGPTADDLRAFNQEDGEDVYCPECGAVISDLADICPRCHSWIPEGAQRTPPAVTALTRRWYAFVVLVVLVVFVYFFIFHM